MIVVAIIGILAAIAIPQYKDYVTRAKWAENNTAIAPLKLAIAECLQDQQGVIASCDTLGELTTVTGYPALPVPTNGTVALIGTTGAIQVTGSASVGSCVVTWTPNSGDNAVKWVGVTSALPAGCTKAKTGV